MTRDCTWRPVEITRFPWHVRKTLFSTFVQDVLFPPHNPTFIFLIPIIISAILPSHSHLIFSLSTILWVFQSHRSSSSRLVSYAMTSSRHLTIPFDHCDIRKTTQLEGSYTLVVCCLHMYSLTSDHEIEFFFVLVPHPYMYKPVT